MFFNRLFKGGQTAGTSKNGQSAAAGTLIDLRGVFKTYATPAGDFHALKGIDLQINPGEFVAVIGKSGSGKSTLSNMITGIDRPSKGEVLVAGTPVHKLSEGQIASWRGRTIGVVFQFFQLLPSLTVMENVLLPMDFCNIGSERERRERALELLALVDMESHAHKLPTALSGGQQQRVAIARALSNDPPILVADEPTGNLDSRTAEAVFHLFETLVDKGKTILMVTHDEDMARRVTRAVTIADGQIAADQAVSRRAAVKVATEVPVAQPAPVLNGHGLHGHPEPAHAHHGAADSHHATHQPTQHRDHGFAGGQPVTGAAYA
jgi:putative ABC transport system ATP-binding protein